jgi:response regulator RpfG family c-di-GMP phosphodiesterase
MSDNEEDDKATVVLDIKALKEELAAARTVEDVDDLEFSATTEQDSNQNISLDDDLDEIVQLQKVVFFDFKSEYFSKLIPKLPADIFDFNLITQLKDLNLVLQSKESATVIFNYNAAPKAVNQLTAQIKAKFPNTQTIIVAKGLSPEKAQAHKNSKAGSNAYLSVPFNVAKFIETVKSVE